MTPKIRKFDPSLQLCANPEVAFHRSTDLSPATLESLGRITRDPGFAGLLEIQGRFMAVSRDLASALTNASELKVGTDADWLRIARLVLDGILQISCGAGFVSGPAAMELLIEIPANGNPPQHCAALALQAIRHAQTLPIEDVSQLQGRLYFYGRAPIRPHWQKQFPSGPQLWTHVGLGRGTDLLRTLTDAFQELPASAHPGWRSFLLRGCRQPANGGAKLYISPRFEHLHEVLPTIVRGLVDLGVPRFKLGATLNDLARPDGIVAYFSSVEQLQATASDLARRLSGVGAQGVPFTCALEPSGLLSWSIDPPREEQILDYRPRDSWRTWICGRLACALLAAKKQAAAGTPPPWLFALARIALDDIDVERWIPINWAQMHAKDN